MRGGDVEIERRESDHALSDHPLSAHALAAVEAEAHAHLVSVFCVIRQNKGVRFI